MGSGGSVGEVRPAEIVETRPARSKTLSGRRRGRSDALRTKGFEYYVHYLGTDRRMDEWVDAERIVGTVTDTSVIVEFEKSKGKSHGRLHGTSGCIYFSEMDELNTYTHDCLFHLK